MRLIISRKYSVIIVLLAQLAISACSFNVTRYTDGPLTQYLGEPLPEMDRPLARSLSVEKVEYNTAANMRGTMISDLVAREIYSVPKEVGLEVDALLRMDDEFSEEATLAALNTIAKKRTEENQMWSGAGLSQSSSGSPGSSSGQYIGRQEELASEAYANGDYLQGNIHNGAASNRMAIDSSFAEAQASVNLAFSVLGAAQSIGAALIQNDFNSLRSWIEQESGAISPQAPEGTHLSVFLLRYFDAKSFQLDSRMRVAVYLVLTKQSGVSTTVLEGSDILVCEDECNLFKPKPTATLFEKTTQSGDMQNLYWTKEGTDSMKAKGLSNLGGPYQYVLLIHGLKKLGDKL